MKTVIWKGEDRVLPNHGQVTAGQVVEGLPDDIAGSLIGQGLADAVAPPSKKSTHKFEQED
jgi:hypothetical protein